jgi:hypothetical protein
MIDYVFGIRILNINQEKPVHSYHLDVQFVFQGTD